MGDLFAAEAPTAAAAGAAKRFAREKLAQMTIEEKVLVLSGENTWRTHGIKRLGISQMKTSDGPTGVRGGKFIEGVTAASPPSG